MHMKGMNLVSPEACIFPYIFVIQWLSLVLLFVIPWTVASQAPLSFTISRSLLKVTSIESVIPSNHLILCCPLHLPPSIFPRIRIFSSKSALHIRWPKYWSFSLSTSPFNEYSGLTSFRIDGFAIFAVQGTLKKKEGIGMYCSNYGGWQIICRLLLYHLLKLFWKRVFFFLVIIHKDI